MGRLGNCKEEIETPMSEQEKTDFVSGKFLYAITDFSLFKRGEAYWLEYIGNDTYCCRSDNHLNEKIRINPCELTRYFSEEPLHSFENILSEFAYHVRTWGLTDGESNIDFCNVEAHRWAKEMIKNEKDMTQEELKGLIIDWFSHIEQLATDRKNLNGYVMDYQDCLDEIKMIAKNSKDFVEQYFEVL